MTITAEDEEIDIRTDETGLVIIRERASAGYHTVSVIADGSAWDWESMYYPLHLFGNNGQVTGPWDFNLLQDNKPLIPSYWVSLNGEALGLWYFQRVAVEDIKQRRFRGRFSFHLPKEGEVKIVLTPFNKGTLRWTSIKLAPRSHTEKICQRFLPLREHLPFFASDLFTKEIVDPKISRLFDEFMQEAKAIASLPKPFFIDAAPARNTYIATLRCIPLYLLIWKRFGKGTFRDFVHEIINEFVKADNWGGFGSPESYGTNGDLIVAEIFYYLTMALCVLEKEMPETLKDRLLIKLELQGRRFHATSLLNEDYWGGSILQDHGWRTYPIFATAALHLAQYLEAASFWADFSLHRVWTSLNTSSRDGALPVSSYRRLDLFGEAFPPLSRSLKSTQGIDPLSLSLFSNTSRYLKQLTTEELQDQCDGALCFLNAMAHRTDDPLFADAYASTLQRQIVDRKNFAAVAHSYIWHLPALKTIQAKESDPIWNHYVESGLIIAGGAQSGAQLRIQCGPPNGQRAWTLSKSPCDKVELFSGDGHFELSIDKQAVLCTPDSAYRLHAGCRTRLLIDESGGRTDLGYPMSAPLLEPHFGCISRTSWDTHGQRGNITLDLKDVFQEEVGVLSYSRNIDFAPDHLLSCTDVLNMERPATLQWLFQLPGSLRCTKQSETIWLLGDHVTFTVDNPSLDITTKLLPTNVVFSYTGSGQQFNTLHVQAQSSSREANIRFTFNW